MGETDEFVLQSSNAEDETVQDPAAEVTVELTIVEPTADDGFVADVASEPEPQSDVPSVFASDATDEPDELDEISQSLAEEADAAVESDAGAVAATDVDETPDAEIADTDPDADADTVADSATDAGSFDDIAPPAPAVAAVSQVPEPTATVGQVPWWPFLVYMGAWVVLAAAAVWQLLQLPADQVVYESPAYVMTILGGLIMTAMGPLLILAVWLGTRASRSPQERHGLLTSALMKGALVTLSGAVIWWAALVIIDYLRLGRLL